MAALVEQLPPRVHFTATALAGSLGANAWSADRVYALGQEVVAKLHYESRLSVHVGDEASNEQELEVMPLLPVRTVRVKYRNIGQLPPMNLEDEIGNFIDD